MKKIFLLLLLVLVSITASARKSYITVYTSNFSSSTIHNNYIILSGDVPDSIEGFEYDSTNHCWRNNKSIRTYSTGEILNVLSEYEYEVEFVNTGSDSGSSLSYLLSKEVSSGQTVSEGDVNKDGEVNIADINKVVALILGIIKENPSILEQIKK